MLRPFGAPYPCFSVGRTDPSGVQLSIGTATYAGLSFARKVFVPASGGFARYLEVLTNPTASPLTTTVQIETSIAAGDSTRVLVDPSSTGSTYAIVDDSAPGSVRPTVAFVFGGANAPAAVTATNFVSGTATVFYRWKVTVPAGGSVTLMHFAVQRAPGDSNSADSQARALATLTDPNALVGISAQDRATIVNFNVP
jgi:hypothetical protein